MVEDALSQTLSQLHIDQDKTLASGSHHTCKHSPNGQFQCPLRGIAIFNPSPDKYTYSGTFMCTDVPNINLNTLSSMLNLECDYTKSDTLANSRYVSDCIIIRHGESFIVLNSKGYFRISNDLSCRITAERLMTKICAVAKMCPSLSK